jgi:hypothetical protein
MAKALAWTPPIGHADIAPSRHERIEYDGYLTIDAHWIIPALLRSVPIEGRVLEPAAGRGHLSLELRRAGLDVLSFDLHRYAHRLVHDIGTGDIRGLTTLEGFAWVVTNLPYSDLEELATHLIGLGLGLGVRGRCGVALLVRTEWIVPSAPQTGERAPSFRRHCDVDSKTALGGASSRQRIAPAQLCLGSLECVAAHRRPFGALCRTMILKGIARAVFCLWRWAGVTPRTLCLGATPVQHHSTASRLRGTSGAAEPFLTQKPGLIVHRKAAIADLELGSAFTRDKAPLDRTKALLEVLKR